MPTKVAVNASSSSIAVAEEDPKLVQRVKELQRIVNKLEAGADADTRDDVDETETTTTEEASVIEQHKSQSQPRQLPEEPLPHKERERLVGRLSVLEQMIGTLEQEAEAARDFVLYERVDLDEAYDQAMAEIAAERRTALAHRVQQLETLLEGWEKTGAAPEQQQQARRVQLQERVALLEAMVNDLEQQQPPEDGATTGRTETAESLRNNRVKQMGRASVLEEMVTKLEEDTETEATTKKEQGDRAPTHQAPVDEESLARHAALANRVNQLETLIAGLEQDEHKARRSAMLGRVEQLEALIEQLEAEEYIDSDEEV